MGLIKFVRSQTSHRVVVTDHLGVARTFAEGDLYPKIQNGAITFIYKARYQDGTGRTEHPVQGNFHYEDVDWAGSSGQGTPPTTNTEAIDYLNTYIFRDVSGGVSA